MENKQDHLQKLEHVLLARGVEVESSVPTEFIPFSHLLLTFASDTSETDVFSVIVSTVGGEFLAANFEAGGPSDLIQILYPSPYQIEKERITEVARFIQLLNKVLILGAFGYDERENRCFFRYTCSISKSQPDYEEVANVLLLIQDLLNTYVGALEDISMGAVTIDELLQQFQQEIALNQGQEEIRQEETRLDE